MDTWRSECDHFKAVLSLIIAFRWCGHLELPQQRGPRAAQRRHVGLHATTNKQAN